MSRVLVIESSARQRGSVSRLLTAEFISHWKAAHPADRFQVRDLAREPLPHLDELLLGAWTTPCDGHSAAERRALERSNRLTEELRIADVLVLAAPMYNFAIPSSLKSWFDHVLRAGLTFRYAEQGPETRVNGARWQRGLLQGGRWTLPAECCWRAVHCATRLAGPDVQSVRAPSRCSIRSITLAAVVAPELSCFRSPARSSRRVGNARTPHSPHWANCR